MKYTYTLSGVIGDELSDGSDYQVKNLYVDLLGKKFQVTDIDLNAAAHSGSREITLVSSQQVETVEVGSSVDYEGYKIEVGDIDPDQGTAYLKLIDENGNVVATDIVAAGDYTDFDGTLSDSIKVDAVFSGTSSKFAKLERLAIPSSSPAALVTALFSRALSLSQPRASPLTAPRSPTSAVTVQSTRLCSTRASPRLRSLTTQPTTS